MAEQYKIELGIGLNKGDFTEIKNKIESLENNPIKLKVDAETKELTNTIKEALNSLSKGTKNALTIDTSKIQTSLDNLSDVITDIRNSLGTLDGKGMKDIVTSINQMATALGKAENESDSLVKSLSALSKKDLSINFGFNMGKSASQMASEQGDIKRNAISQLKQQAKALESYLDQYYKVAQQGKGVVKLIQGTNLFSGFWEMSPNIGNTKVSLKQQVDTYKQYINLMQEAAKIKGVDLSGVTSGFSKTTSDIVEETKRVSNGAEEIKQAFKGLLGGGIGAEQLSAQLEPIVGDLKLIQEAVTALSKDTSLGGLTASFNRLSESIENLLANAEKVKGVLNSGFDSSKVGSTSTSSTPSSTPAITSAQQTGKKIGETVEQSVKQSINFDDVIDKQVLDLMDKFTIAGDKGSKAFNEIKQAVLECRNELNVLKNSDIGIDEEVFDTSRAIDKVTDAIANQHRAANDLGDEYVKLANYMTSFNDPAKGNKVRLPDFVKQEQGSDYTSNRGSLGIAFNTERGISFTDFINDINDVNNGLGVTIDLTKGEAAAFDELLRKVEIGRQQREALKKSENYRASTASTDEILEQNGINRNEIYDDVMSIVGVIDTAEQKIAQSSAEMANEIAQSGEKIEQSYREVANVYEKISKGTSLVGNDDSFQKTFEASNQAAQEAQRHFQELLADEKAVVSVTEQFDDNNALQSFVVNIKRATGEVETLRYAMDKLDDEENGSFRYQSGSTTDRNVEKQFETRIKKANDLQIKLDKIKTDYENMGANKPIKEEAHIKSLSEQYDKVQAAIESVKNADNSTYASMVSNAEKEKAALESLVKVYRSAETFSTDLRAKDRNTAKEVYSSRLDVLSSKMRKDGVYDGLSSDVDALGMKISSASDVAALSEIANELTKLDAKYKSAKAAKDEFNRSQNVGSSISGLRSEIEILQNASPSIKSFKTEINGVEVSIESLLKDLDQVSTKGDFDVVKGKVEAFGKAAEAAGIDLNEAKTEAKKASDAYKQMLDIQKQIRSLSIKEKNLTELGNTSELNEVSAKLKDLKSDYETLKKTFGSKLTSTQFGTLQAEIDEIESELKQLDAKWADTKAKLSKSIKLNIKTGKYDNQLSQMEDNLNKLSFESKELHDSVEQVRQAYNQMELALEGTGDEVADRERLIQAEQEYARALEKTNNLIRIQARIDKTNNDAIKLQDNREKFQGKIDAWMAKNSAATKQFGAQLLDLRAKAEKADQVTLNHLESELYKVDKAAEKAGAKGLNTLDRIKDKFKEYMGYFSVAEVFMWAEQGLREMFNTVKEIDTAMTGLYRVTDLTASQYDSLFNEMIGSAKEYGATLNDIINATTDWVRAGFDANTALGMAEVTTMYQHISDLDYDTAAENLITAYNGFKKELNGAFDGDQVAAVNYIADIFNELDNNFAITSAGLGEAMTRSASALDLAGNTIQETAG